MGNAFIQAMQWCVLVILGIAGFYFLSSASDLSDIRNLIAGAACFGAIYMMFRLWKDLPILPLIASSAIISALAFLSQDDYIPSWIYNYGHYYWGYGYFESLAAFTGTIGLFIMTIVFYHFNDD